jgi:uncharacterized protein
MSEQVRNFPCGDATLIGISHQAHSTGSENASQMGLLIVVGGPQYRVGSHRQFLLMARQVAKAGFPVFRFDYRGMGDSSGQSRTFDQINDDIKAAIDNFFSTNPSLRSICIFGLCDGASAALLYCNTDHRVRALFLANPWVRTSTSSAEAIVSHYYSKRILQKDFWAKLLTGGVNPFSAGWKYLKMLRQSKSTTAVADFLSRMTSSVSSTTCAVRFALSEDDLVAKEFESLCGRSTPWEVALGRSNVSVVRFAGADHTFSEESHLFRCNEDLVQFMADAENARA